MKELSTLDAFRKFASTSSDEGVMTATADADAAAGIYNVRRQQTGAESQARFERICSIRRPLAAAPVMR